MASNYSNANYSNYGNTNSNYGERRMKELQEGAYIAKFTGAEARLNRNNHQQIVFTVALYEPDTLSYVKKHSVYFVLGCGGYGAEVARQRLYESIRILGGDADRCFAEVSVEAALRRINDECKGRLATASVAFAEVNGHTYTNVTLRESIPADSSEARAIAEADRAHEEATGSWKQQQRITAPQTRFSVMNGTHPF